MKKVLILGYQGTLGQTLMKEFGGFSYEVVGWDRGDIDITAPEAAGKIVALHPDIIINATGYNAVDKAEGDPKEKEICFALNSEAPRNLALIAKELGAIFVNYSSDYVFRGNKISGYTETDVPDPISVYGESKYLGEKNIQSVGGKFYIVRPSRIFGHAGSSVGSKKSFVDIVIEKKDDAEIKVVDAEKGSPTYAPDLAQFTRELLESGAEYGIYHGTNSGAATWYEWAKEIFSIKGLVPNLTPVPGDYFVRAAHRPEFSQLLNTKRPPQRSWQEALREYLQ